MSKGFTLLEVIIVIAIFILLAGIFIPVGLNFFNLQLLSKTEDHLLSYLKSARSSAINQKNNSDFGVYRDSNNIVLFQGSNYAGRDTDMDMIYEIPSIISMSGLQEIVFTKYSGQPNNPGSFTINYTDQVKQITINSEGSINF